MITTKEEIKLEKHHFAEKTAVIAKSGYGKSYGVRVLIEEGIENGHTFVVIDPQGAYDNLTGFSYINATAVKSASALGAILAQSNKNTVIRMKQLGEDDQNKFLNALLVAYKKHIRKGIQTIVIDEMHKYAPEGQSTDAKQVVRSMYQENRSDGLGIIGVTQRPARMDKTCLSQADNLIIGRVTSFRDKEAVKAYMDNPDDIEQVTKFEKGQCLFIGFGLDEPVVAQIRKASSQHSGETPQNLLNENSAVYDSSIAKAVDLKRNTPMDKQDIVAGVVPSVNTVWQFAKNGMKMSLGLAASGLASAYIGSKFKSPIPVISSRTLGATATSVALYAAYRFANAKKFDVAADVLGYATAGSAAFLVGSVAYDLISASKVQLPNWAAFTLTTATGVAPAAVENSANAGVDVNTSFAA